MTKEYLSKDSKELFWLFWLGIPYFIWIYSIRIEKNKKKSKNRKLNKIILIGLIAYPIIYIPIGMIFMISGIGPITQITTF